MSQTRQNWAKYVAIASLVAPATAAGLARALPEAQAEAARTIAVAGGLLVVVGFVLAAVALAMAGRSAPKGISRWATAGLAVNGVILLGMIALLPALRRVALARNAGLTAEQMAQMPDVISGSRAILDETLGFRMEVPGDFLDNPQPQPPNILYSFVRLNPGEPGLAINVELLGGRISQEPIDAEFYAGLRRTLPHDAQIEQAAMPWQGHQLDAFGTQFSMGEATVCAWTVQVPLAKEAIQISVGGPGDAGPACRELLGTVLSSVRGVSDWDAPPSLTSARSWFRPGPRRSTAAQ